MNALKLQIQPITTLHFDRTESDLTGEKHIPYGAYYGIQSLRAKENFDITGEYLPYELIIALAQVKKACAVANKKSSLLEPKIADAIVKSCDNILSGDFHGEFIVDQIQGGAGTSANMNANEVIANIALEKMGFSKGDYEQCSPYDHVNMSQSTNDVYPTALKIALIYKGFAFISELSELEQALLAKAKEFANILKVGRTQMMDAVPITLGQEFHAYATAVKRGKRILKTALNELLYINMGGTAIGTGINTSEYFYHHIADELSKITTLNFTQSEDLIDGTQNIDSFALVSSALKNIAISLSKMSNDIRLMNSGPCAGFGEISIPSKQNGSSIMPGKVNPVIPEVLNQACFLTIGNDVAVTMACEGGQFELNAFEPLVFNRIFESLTVLKNAVCTFRENCVVGIVANKDRCDELLYNSTALITALCPVIGYKEATKIANRFLKDRTPITEQTKAYGISEQALRTMLSPDILARQFERKGE